jgi:hypothetical protein
MLFDLYRADAQLQGISAAFKQGTRERLAIFRLLRDLSGSSDQNKQALLAPRYNLQTMIIECLKGTNDEIVASLSVCMNMSTLEDVKSLLLGEPFGLAIELIRILREPSTSSQARTAALIVVRNLCSSKQRVVDFICTQQDTIQVLIYNASSPQESHFEGAVLAMQCLISQAPDVVMAHIDVKSMSSYLLAVLPKCVPQTKVTVMESIIFLARVSSELQASLQPCIPALAEVLAASPSVDMRKRTLRCLAVLTKWSKDKPHQRAVEPSEALCLQLVESIKLELNELTSLSISVLLNLCSYEEYNGMLCSPTLGVATYLLTRLSSGGIADVGMNGILDIFIELSSDGRHKNRRTLGKKELNIPGSLITVIKRDKGDKRLKALKIIHNLSSQIDNVEYFASAQVDLFIVLMEVVFDHESDKDGNIIEALLSIKKLLGATENSDYIKSLQLGLMKLMMEILTKDSRLPILNALDILLMLISAPDSAVYVGASLYLGLIDRFVALILHERTKQTSDYDIDLAVASMNCITQVSKNKEHIEYLISNSALQAMIVLLIRSETTDATFLLSEDLLDAFMLDNDHCLAVASFPGITDALLSAILSAKNNHQTFSILNKLSKAAGQVLYSTSKDYNMVQVLCSCLNNAGSDRDAVLQFFESLTSWAANVDLIISDSNEFYPKLLALLKCENLPEACYATILNILYNISSVPSTAILMCSRKYNLFEILCGRCKTNGSTDGPLAELRIFRCLSTTNEVIDIVGSEDSGYVQMVSVILDKPLPPICLDEIWTTLRQLSAHSISNQLFIACSPSHDLLRKIRSLLSRPSQESSTSSTSLSVLKLLRNLTAASKNHLIVADEENGFLPLLSTAISTEEGDAAAVALAVLRNITADPTIAARLLDEKYNFIWHLKQMVMRGVASDVVANILSTFFNLSMVQGNIKALGDPETGIISSLIEMLNSGHREIRFICLRVLHNLSLSTDDAQNDSLLSSDNNLMSLLIEYIHEGRDVDQVLCIQIITALSSSSIRVRTELGSNQNLINALVDVFSSTKLEPRLFAISLVQLLFTIPANIESMIMPPSFLLQKLNLVFRECVAGDITTGTFSYPVSCYLDILKILSSVASSQSQMKQLLIAAKEISFLKPLLDCLKNDFPIEIQVLVYNVLKICALHPQNKLLFMSPRVGLIAIFRNHLARFSAIHAHMYIPLLKELVGLLVQLSMVTNNLELLGEPSNLLIPGLINLLALSEDAIVIDTLSFLLNVSTVGPNVVYLGSRELGLVQALAALAANRTFDVEISIPVLTLLRNLSGSPENVELIGEKETGLLGIISGILKNYSEFKFDALVHASLILLQNLCWSQKNSLFIGSSSSSLIPLVLEIAKQGPERLTSTALEIIRNLTSFMETLEYLLSPGLGLVDSLLNLYANASRPPHYAVVIFGIFCNCADDRVVIDVMLQNKIHRLALKALSTAPADASSWGSEETEYSNALVFLLNCCKWPESFRDLIDAGADVALQRYLKYDSEHGLRSFVALIYLMRGREDQAIFQSISAGHFNFMYLVDIVEGFRDANLRKYADSMPLKVFLRAIVCMCMSESNLKEYMTPRLTALFMAVIQRQFKNQFKDGIVESGCTANPDSEHSGEDFELEAAEVALEGLLLSSFRFDSTKQSLDELIPEPMRDSLRPILIEYSSAPNIRAEVVYKSLYILYYFFGADGINGLNVTKSVLKQQHLVLSHSVLRSEKATLVSQLYSQLVENGLEVWMDISGSAVAPAESCDSSETKVARIHAALAAAFVVICLSKSYKTDIISRMELKLAIDSGANVLVLFLESDYTLDSEGDRIDGWLEILKSGCGMQMMWVSSLVRNAVEFIVSAIGPNAARHDVAMRNPNGVGSVAGIEQPASPGYVSASEEATILGISPEKLDRLETAWNIIQSPSNSVDIEALNAYLDKMGVYCALDLRQCDEDDLQTISNLLKKIQMKRFMQCF